LESPVNNIIKQLRTYILNKNLKSGDKIPPERKLAEELEVSRRNLRDAIRKMEFYGLLKTHPQSGTRVKGKGVIALEGIAIDILDFEKEDFESIIETRNLLEIKCTGLAALKRTEEDIQLILEAKHNFEKTFLKEESAEHEDLLFHFQIAEISGNSILKLLLKIITPDILKNSLWKNRLNQKSKEQIIKEHQEIVDQIISQNVKESKNAMRNHLKGL